MRQFTINEFRIVPAPMTGIGWVSVEKWDDEKKEYLHYSTFRTESFAREFIKIESRTT
jgi:hypothetical protein